LRNELKVTGQGTLDAPNFYFLNPPLKYMLFAVSSLEGRMFVSSGRTFYVMREHSSAATGVSEVLS
jgi:hypothetical protein